MLKLKVAVSLLALAVWLYPINTVASKEVQPPIVPIENQQIVSKDNTPETPTVTEPVPEPVSKPLPKPKKSVQPPTEKIETVPVRQYSKEEVQQLIRDYASQYGVNVDLVLSIARCESGFNQHSKNRSSTASGVFQYLSSTWKNTPAGRSGQSVFDADANIKMAVSSIAANGTAPWNASRHCWK